MATEDTATTGEALQVAGIDFAAFRRAMDRGQYTSAPKTLPGNRQRGWTVNDIVALRFFQFLFEAMRMPAAVAGGLTKQLEIGLTNDPDARELGIYSIKRPKRQTELLIRAEPPRGSTVVMPLPVGDWRREIRAELRELWRRQRA